MTDFIHIGFGNMVNASHIDAIVTPESSPVKRMIQTAKEAGIAIDATAGRRTKSVLLLENGHLVLSALLPETITGRAKGTEGSEEGEPEEE